MSKPNLYPKGDNRWRLKPFNKKKHENKTKPIGHRFPPVDKHMVELPKIGTRADPIFYYRRGFLRNGFTDWYKKSHNGGQSLFFDGDFVIIVPYKGNHISIVRPDYSVALDYVPKKLICEFEFVEQIKQGEDDGAKG